MTKKKRRPPEKKKLSKVEEALEMLLDPFAPVLFPGVHHFAIGAFFSFACMGSSFFPIIDIIVPDAKNFKAHFYTSLAVFIPLVFLYVMTLFFVAKGIKWAYNIFLFCLLSPLVPSIVFFFFHAKASRPQIKTIELAAVFSLIGFFLLRSKSCRALINILVIRRHKKQQMKKEGTYATNLACSKLKYFGVPNKFDDKTVDAALSLEKARQESRKTG